MEYEPLWAAGGRTPLCDGDTVRGLSLERHGDTCRARGWEKEGWEKTCVGNGEVTGGMDVGCACKSKMAPVGSGRPGTFVTTAELDMDGASAWPHLPCNPAIAAGSKPYREQRSAVHGLLPFVQEKSKGLGVRERGGLGENTALLLFYFQGTSSVALGLEKPGPFSG